MADLEPLIRYRKHGVDEKRRFLAQLYQKTEALAQEKQAIEETIEKETVIAHELGTAESLSDLGNFTKLSKQRITVIEKEMKKLEVRIAAAQEEMREAFAEMKKVEITQRNRKAREEAEQKHKEEQELDEVALENHRRRQEED